MTAATPDEPLDALGSEWSVGVTRLNEFEHLFGKAEHVELLNLVGGRVLRRGAADILGRPAAVRHQADGSPADGAQGQPDR